jgi:hypothetical protein
MLYLTMYVLFVMRTVLLVVFLHLLLFEAGCMFVHRYTLRPFIDILWCSSAPLSGRAVAELCAMDRWVIEQ